MRKTLSQHSSGFTTSFHLRSNISTEGMCHPARSLPFSMKVMVEVEMFAFCWYYISTNPTISAPIVPVVKQVGASQPICICGDYTWTLNWLIDRDSYTLPHIEEILHKIAGTTVYIQSSTWEGCISASWSIWRVKSLLAFPHIWDTLHSQNFSLESLLHCSSRKPLTRYWRAYLKSVPIKMT